MNGISPAPLEEVGWPWHLMSPHGPTHQSCCDSFFNSWLGILLLGFTPLFLCSRLHTPEDQQTGNKARPLLAPYRCGPAPQHVLTVPVHHSHHSYHFQSTPCTLGNKCSEARYDCAHSARICTQNLNSCALSGTCPFASQEAQLVTLVFVVGYSQLMSQTLQVLVFWAGRDALSPSTEF